MRILSFILALICPPLAAMATEIEVDLELILMVDVSRSMTENELEIQRRGYAEALQSADVYAAVQSGLLQRVAMSYVEWAGTQRVVVDWRVLETPDDLAAFARTLTAKFDPTLRRTSIASAIEFGVRSIEDNEFAGLRRVIDISGDGPNNQGIPVTDARDHAISQGFIINGLPLMTQESYNGRSWWNLDDLDEYYRHCVIGGPGAFVIPVLDWNDFAAAVRKKLVLEIAGLRRAPLIRAQHKFMPKMDCLIGEKLRRQREDMWSDDL